MLKHSSKLGVHPSRVASDSAIQRITRAVAPLAIAEGCTLHSDGTEFEVRGPIRPGTLRVWHRSLAEAQTAGATLLLKLRCRYGRVHQTRTIMSGRIWKGECS
jgi:hypothetical protein